MTKKNPGPSAGKERSGTVDSQLFDAIKRNVYGVGAGAAVRAERTVAYNGQRRVVIVVVIVSA